MYSWRIVAMLAVNIFTAAAIILWTGLLWIGIGLTRGVADRHISGYPSAVQIFYSIGMPATLIALLILAFIIFNFVRHSPLVLAYLAGASMLILFFDLIEIDGGM